MEHMYSKLHDKYTKLKSKKEDDSERINLDQEIKFMEFKSAADELIEHLKNENFRQHLKIIDLKSEMASIRQHSIDLEREMASIRSSEADQHGEPKENQNENNMNVQGVQIAGKDKTGSSTPVTSDNIDLLNSNSKRKRRRGSTPVESGTNSILKSNSTRKSSRLHRTVEKAPENDSTCDELRQIALLGSGVHIHQPACCRRTQDLSGGECNCVFQDIVENWLGMKTSAAIQADGICISALHQSSEDSWLRAANNTPKEDVFGADEGSRRCYSFTLTLVDKEIKGDMEWVYYPISLGTLEMGAPEWMKEVIKFSMSMLPIFFERVLRVIE